MKTPRTRRNWTPEEDAQLRALRSAHTIAELAAILGRSAGSIRNRADALRLLSPSRPRPWTQEEEAFLILKCEKYSYTQLAKRLGRPFAVVNRRALRLGLTPCCGVYSRRQLERDTGYSSYQLERARDALQMRWKRAGNRFTITEKQRTLLCNYLRDEGKPEATVTAIVTSDAVPALAPGRREAA